jgi:hypothetical protein
MKPIFERFCYNDVEESCMPFFNCTPCHLTLADPSCNRIQYVGPFSCHDIDKLEMITKLKIKTDAEMENCRELRIQCQVGFQDCLEPFSACIRSCTRDLSEETLDKYDNYEGIL